MKFIQFIGTQRSGSNLLRTMLNQLPQITAPHPPHILKIFGPVLSIYGNLNDDKKFESLVNDVCSWIELNPVPWKIDNFDRHKIKDLCKENTLIELLYVVYAYYTKLDQGSFACCKSMSNVYQYNELEASGLEPYYIYLHRDGRDVACSFKKALIGEKHVYHIAKQWKADQERSLEAERNIPSNRFIKVNYRDLITNPKLVLERLCTFLNVPFRHYMLDYFHAEESINTAKSGEMWKNLSLPIMAENYNKYLTELSNEEIKLFEHVAGDILERLGYSVLSNYKNSPEIKQTEIDQYNLKNDSFKIRAVEKADAHDIVLRCPQKEFLKTLTDRLAVEENKTKRKAG